MGLCQTQKLLHSKGKHPQNEKATSKMGENICNQPSDKGLISKRCKELTQFNRVKKKKSDLKLGTRGFPRGPVVKNPPSNAGNVGLIPRRRTKIPRASDQLSPRATTSEHLSHNERGCVLQRRSHTTKTLRSQK